MIMYTAEQVKKDIYDTEGFEVDFQDNLKFSKLYSEWNGHDSMPGHWDVYDAKRHIMLFIYDSVIE